MNRTPSRPSPLSSSERQHAASARDLLDLHVRATAVGPKADTDSGVVARLKIGRPDAEAIDVPVPPAALALLLKILDGLAAGQDMSVVAADREVTTQQAAEFLNVSRPYFVKLLEEGKIPFRTVGPRRRVRVADLLAHRARGEAGRQTGLDALAAEAQRLGLY